MLIVFFKQKTAYEMRISDWSSDVCSSDLSAAAIQAIVEASGVRTRPLKQARDWGYQRLVASKVVVLADAAPPPIARVTEAGCASTLAFELSDGDERIGVNIGGADRESTRLNPRH